MYSPVLIKTCTVNAQKMVSIAVGFALRADLCLHYARLGFRLWRKQLTTTSQEPTHTQIRELSNMPQVQVPWAMWAKFENEHGKKQGRLVYLKDGQSLDDAVYELNRICNEMSTKTGVNFWLEEYHPILKPVDVVPVGYRLT